MTQPECNRDPILAILNGYSEFRKIGTYEEEKRSMHDAGYTLELCESPKPVHRFLQISYTVLDEETEIAALERGEGVWLKVDRDELLSWV